MLSEIRIPRKLFSPTNIGSVRVKNRIVLPPLVLGQAEPNGRVTEGHIRFYETRAKGGAGLIIVESTAIVQRGQSGPNLLAIWDNSFIPGFKQLTKTVHAYGTKIFLQLCHAGRQTCKAFTGGQLPVAPSAIPCPVYEPKTHEVPEELSVEDIEQIIEDFGKAAIRTKEAGFDGLEIHGAHGYLVSGFMSPYTNKRHDAYGGDLIYRMKFPLEVIETIRREVGGDFPIGFRYSGNEFVPDGRTIEESKKIARILEAAGVDYLHVSGGVYESFWALIQPYGIREGFLADDAAAIKQVVNIPVIAVGKIKSPEVAEEILEQGKADLVAIGRQLICDPDWPTKVREGDWEDIRPCIYCTQGCINRGIVEGAPACCIYNTAAGMEKEAEMETRLAEAPKRVLVVGGGPGGLEAARIAALRGHRVTLFEKEEKLGGRFNLASIAPFKQEFTLAIKWLVSQVRKLGVQVEAGKEVTPELVEEMSPDAVIIATGAVPQIPNLPGADKGEVVAAEDILAGKVSMGNRVVILGGGGVGTEVADFMAQRGKQVTIVEMMPEIGILTGIPLLVAQLLIPRLLRYGVKILTRAEVKEIIDGGVVVTIDGKEGTINGIDQIIAAMGPKSVDELAKKLEGKVTEVYVIGDAKEPRTAYEATHEGAEAARVI
ncbi:MAG: FAD-dependent oxidoreductase [Thermodesulfobacteriota bacterium]|jgi:2,4-dienoyl-CoA reductase-like NADH-dependent reductase (Old Yellow Enzyme family)/thioredoxin reductase